MSGGKVGPEDSLEIVINEALIKIYIGLHMTTVERCIGEELVSFREDPSSRRKEGKFHNLISTEITPNKH